MAYDYRLIISMFEIVNYQRPIHFDGQQVPLHFFPNRKELIGKIITITLSAKKKDQIIVDNENIISRHTQPVYARRKEEIFARIIQVDRGYQLKTEIINNPLSSSNPNSIFHIHDVKSTAYFEHSQCISKMITDNVTMESDLITYFTSINYSDDFDTFENGDKSWIDQSFLNRINKNPTKHDIDTLGDLLTKRILDQEAYDKYINHYIPLNNIYKSIVEVLSAQKYTKSAVKPDDVKLDEHKDCITQSYASYGYDNNNNESRYVRSGEVIHINVQNIHYIPLDLNQLSDLKKYKYRFGKIEKPMTFGGRLYEDRDGVLASLKIGNIVRCVFRKQSIDDNSTDDTGTVWYFYIIQIIDSTMYGLLKDPYYDPKDYGLNEGDIMIFHKDNITEIPRDWSENSNLKDFKLLDVGYFPTGCVCTVDSEE